MAGWRQAERNHPFGPFYKLFPIFFSVLGALPHATQALLDVVPSPQHPAGLLIVILCFSRKAQPCFFSLPLINVRNIVLSCSLYPNAPLISSPHYSACVWGCSVLMSLSVTVFKDCIFREAGDGKDLLEAVGSCLRKQESSRVSLTTCEIGSVTFGLWGWHMCFFQLSSLAKANFAYQNEKLPPHVKGCTEGLCLIYKHSAIGSYFHGITRLKLHFM